MSKWYKGKRIFKGKKRILPTLTTGSPKEDTRIQQPHVNNQIPRVISPSSSVRLPKSYSRKRDHRKERREKRKQAKTLVAQKKQQLKVKKPKAPTAKDVETDRIARILIKADYAGDELLNYILDEYNKAPMSWSEAEKKSGKVNAHVVEVREMYRRLAHMAMKYKSIDELEKAIKSSKGITKSTLKHLRDVAMSNPNIYNTDVSRETYEQPTEQNTADSSRLIYDSIMDLIEKGLNVPRKEFINTTGTRHVSYFGSFEAYLAYYLKETLDKEEFWYDTKYTTIPNIIGLELKEAKKQLKNLIKDFGLAKAIQAKDIHATQESLKYVKNNEWTESVYEEMFGKE